MPDCNDNEMQKILQFFLNRGQWSLKWSQLGWMKIQNKHKTGYRRTECQTSKHFPWSVHWSQANFIRGVLNKKLSQIKPTLENAADKEHLPLAAACGWHHEHLLPPWSVQIGKMMQSTWKWPTVWNILIWKSEFFIMISFFLIVSSLIWILQGCQKLDRTRVHFIYIHILNQSVHF